MATSDTITVSVEPSDATIRRMVKAGQLAVMELVCTDGCRSHQEIAEQYMRRIYAAAIGKGA